jgi:ATP-dependent Clp protease ATP-binding subunit ClpB
MTSNLGSDVIQSMAGEARYSEMKDSVMAIVGQHFRPEFINRIDDVVVFHPLNREQIRGIASRQLDILASRLVEHDLSLSISDEAIDKLAEVGYDPVFGARPLKRAIQQRIENPLAEALIKGRFLPGEEVNITMKDGQFSFSERVLAPDFGEPA